MELRLQLQRRVRKEERNISDRLRVWEGSKGYEYANR